MANEKNEKQKVTRAMPYNAEAEASVLGSILIDDKAADRLVPMLKSSDFYIAPNRIIFEAMRDLQGQSKPIDAVTVSDKLELDGKLDDIGSISYLSELAEGVLSSANGEYYAELVKRDGLIRRVINAGNDIVKNGYDSTDGAAALEVAEKLIYEISDESSQTSLVKADEAFATALNKINAAQVGKVDASVVKTDFPYFDRYTRGLKAGELVLIAARPSVGKTAFVLNVAANVALNRKNPKNVAIFSLEMGADLLAKRMLAYVSGVSLSDMDRQGGLNGRQIDKLGQAFKCLINAGIYIDDYSMNSPTDILSKCRRLKREKGLDLIIIDYLQLMNGKRANGRDFESRQVEVSDMSRKMKVYAKELGCPIVLLSQMSRRIENGNGNHIPMLSDLRESGSIEQDADIVAFLYKPSQYNSALPQNEVVLDIKKNRNGPVGGIKFEWTGETTTFKEIGPVEENQEIEKSVDKSQSSVESLREDIDTMKSMQEVAEDMPFDAPFDLDGSEDNGDYDDAPEEGTLGF